MLGTGGLLHVLSEREAFGLVPVAEAFEFFSAAEGFVCVRLVEVVVAVEVVVG